MGLVHVTEQRDKEIRTGGSGLSGYQSRNTLSGGDIDGIIAKPPPASRAGNIHAHAARRGCVYRHGVGPIGVGRGTGHNIHCDAYTMAHFRN